jgi:hypothetical protein
MPNTLSVANVMPSNVAVSSTPMLSNVAFTPMVLSAGTASNAGTASTASSGCNAASDSGLTQAIRDLTQAVQANTQALNALAQRMPGDSEDGGSGDFGPPPPSSRFGAPTSAGVAGVASSPTSTARLPDYVRAERSFDYYLGRRNLQRAEEVLRRSEATLQEHQQSVARMKKRLKAMKEADQ